MCKTKKRKVQAENVACKYDIKENGSIESNKGIKSKAKLSSQVQAHTM